MRDWQRRETSSLRSAGAPPQAVKVLAFDEESAARSALVLADLKKSEKEIGGDDQQYLVAYVQDPQPTAPDTLYIPPDSV